MIQHSLATIPYTSPDVFTAFGDHFGLTFKMSGKQAGMIFKK